MEVLLKSKNCGAQLFLEVNITTERFSKSTFNSGDSLSIVTSLTIIDKTLRANQNDAAYFWYNCKAETIITDSIGQTFSPRDTGVYAAIIRRFSCQDTSACVAVFPVGLPENTFQSQLSYYPNPTNGLVQIDFTQLQNNLTVEVYSIQGKLVQTKNFRSGDSFELNLNQPSGIYFIHVTNDKGERANLKVVKQ